MALTAAQIKAREGKLTASRVACLMSGDVKRIYNLWLEMTGDPSFEPEDFSDVWFVQLGNATESLNLDWVARSHGPVVGRGKVFYHPEIDWAASTLDGWLEERGCPVEAKHNNGFDKIEDVIQRYMPQMHWQMICTDADECALSVIRGAKAPEVHFIKFDGVYAAELLERATRFMGHVRMLTPPVMPPAGKAPRVEATKTIDMSGVEAWAVRACEYLNNHGAAKKYLAAEAEIKKLVPADAMVAHGWNITVKRSKNGALRIQLGEPRHGEADEE